MSTAKQIHGSKLTAKTGFAGALTLVAASAAINQSIRTLLGGSPEFADWVQGNSTLAQFSYMAIKSISWAITSYCFVRVITGSSAFEILGLERRPTLAGWAFAWFAFGLGLLSLYLAEVGRVTPDAAAEIFYRKGAPTWRAFTFFDTILGPLIEEITMRGFLFKAFRGTFGLYVSTSLVLGVQTYFHWGLVFHDIEAFGIFILGGIILCLLMEYTESSWNCFLFHATYNATVARLWPIWIVAMLPTFFICKGIRHRRGEANALGSELNK